MILEEIKLGEDDESKKKAVLENLGKQVILKDRDEGLAHGYLSKYGNDRTCYFIEIADPRGEKRLFYHDLQQLILLKLNKDYPLPRIK